MTCPNCAATNADNARFCHRCGAALAAARPMQGERKLVTVLFADVVDSTAMAERLDPEQFAEVMNGAFAFMSAAVAMYGGTVARLMGDSVLAFFGAPVAHEDDAERAVRAGLTIRADAREYARAVEPTVWHRVPRADRDQHRSRGGGRDGNRGGGRSTRPWGIRPTSPHASRALRGRARFS
jgi:class 3 adenylate cyclase